MYTFVCIRKCVHVCIYPHKCVNAYILKHIDAYMSMFDMHK